ncbi:hypothetical protein [Clostridium hydrogeniformans]|uniref:hypothetical protein n=1 Tax=Clostridium hydrogeniformans TaxID=349933 RepID=UPI000485EFDB|nr:hypothetical protein [Clostridium hydrogeniformans]
MKLDIELDGWDSISVTGQNIEFIHNQNDIINIELGSKHIMQLLEGLYKEGILDVKFLNEIIEVRKEYISN